MIRNLKIALSTVMLLITLSAQAQNMMSSLYEITPGVNYPNNMLHIKSWIDLTTSKLLYSDLQSSTSSNSDNTFISFSLIGNSANNIILPNASGIAMNFTSILPSPKFKSQQVIIMYQTGLKAYKATVDPTTFDYSLESYFGVAVKVLRLQPVQMIANTMNMMMESSEKKDKYEQLIDDINKQMSTNIAYPINKAVTEVQKLLNKQFPSKTNEIIYNTYIKVKKDDKKTLKNMEKFFAITQFFPSGIIAGVDDLINPNFKISMDKSETLVLPLSIISPVKTGKSLSDSPIRFEYKFISGTLNYKERKLEVTFKGNLSQQAQLTKGLLIDYENGIAKLVKPKKMPTIPISSIELKFIIAEDGLSVQVLNPDYGYYQLFKNTWVN
jgi:hypothetical protein